MTHDQGPAGPAGVVAVVVARRGGVPAGADEAVAEAGGAVLVVGTDPRGALEGLPSARRAWCAPTGTALPHLARYVAATVRATDLVVMPASPDGRDLAPRVAAELGRPVLAGAVGCALGDGRVHADLLRADGRVVVPCSAAGAAVVTLWPGARPSEPADGEPEIVDLAGTGSGGDAALVEPDPATMDLSEAVRVLGGGAGLVAAGTGDDRARAWFALLGDVAAAVGASSGATRVVTDAGWMTYDRQIGTTGVTLAPQLYVAFGISGASQHVGGLGQPAHTVSVNLDGSCPMTAMSDLGLVADAPAVLIGLARRLGVAVPELLAVPEVPADPEGGPA